MIKVRLFLIVVLLLFSIPSISDETDIIEDEGGFFNIDLYDSFVSGISLGISNFNRSIVYVLIYSIFSSGKPRPDNMAITLCDIFAMSIIEELLFRGLLIPVTDISLSYIIDNDFIRKETVLSLTSTLFGLAHLSNDNPSILQVVVTVDSGYRYGEIFLEKGILAAMIAHFSNNLILFVLMKTPSIR